jgi:hypothetical protein
VTAFIAGIVLFRRRNADSYHVSELPERPHSEATLKHGSVLGSGTGRDSTLHEIGSGRMTSPALSELSGDYSQMSRNF